MGAGVDVKGDGCPLMSPGVRRAWALVGSFTSWVLAGVGNAVGVQREAMCVYASEFEAVESPEAPADVSVEVVRATEVASVVQEGGSTTPDASSAGVHDSDFVALATDADGAVVGWTCLRVETPVVVEERGVIISFDGAYLWGLFVVPGERRRGIGTALVRAASTFADADRVGCAYALVESDNERSRRLFESAGYEHVDSVTGFRLPVIDRHVPSLGGRRSYDGGAAERNPPNRLLRCIF